MALILWWFWSKRNQNETIINLTLVDYIGSHSFVGWEVGSVGGHQQLYPNDISSLKYCVADVEAFRQTLVDVAGFKEDKIFLMIDGMTDRMEPTHINVIARLGILSR